MRKERHALRRELGGMEREKGRKARKEKEERVSESSNDEQSAQPDGQIHERHRLMSPCRRSC